MSRQRRAVIAGWSVVCLLTASACTSNDDDAASRLTLVVRQEVPTLTDVDLAEGGKTLGDLLFFEAPIVDDDGNTGEVIGSLATADLPEPAGEPIEDRLANLVFDFGDDSLVVLGATEYPAEQSEMKASQPQVRAVVGGTGRFLGARGEVVTERQEDGTYVHTFTLLDITD